MEVDVKLVIEIRLEKLSVLLPGQVSDSLWSTYAALPIAAV
jgi:hypothetical protein